MVRAKCFQRDKAINRGAPITAQAGFVRGLQEAVQAWQKQTTEALGTVASTTAFGDPTWSNLFKPWEQLLPTGSTGQTASGKPATKGSR